MARSIVSYHTIQYLSEAITLIDWFSSHVLPSPSNLFPSYRLFSADYVIFHSRPEQCVSSDIMRTFLMKNNHIAVRGKKIVTKVNVQPRHPGTRDKCVNCLEVCDDDMESNEKNMELLTLACERNEINGVLRWVIIVALRAIPAVFPSSYSSKPPYRRSRA